MIEQRTVVLKARHGVTMVACDGVQYTVRDGYITVPEALAPILTNVHTHGFERVADMPKPQNVATLKRKG